MVTCKSYDIEAIQEQVNERNAILVDPNDVTAISKAIEKLCDDRDLLKKMSDESIRLVTGNSMSLRAKKIKELLEKVLNDNK